MGRSFRYPHLTVAARAPGDVDAALAALGADELRAFVKAALTGLEAGPRGQLEDDLVRRAAGSAAGWTPPPPSAAAVEEVQRFVASARLIGQADPAAFDEALRHAVTASLAGAHETARALFESLLAPLADGQIDLGQDELADEVLSVDLSDCLARHLAAIYVTTPDEGRADAVFDALRRLGGLGYVTTPLEEMERALGHPLPALDAFLPRWSARIERALPPPGKWESDEARWLREAVTRRDGLAGLERIARTTRTGESLRAWCNAVVAGGDWGAALEAYEAAAALAESPEPRGDFLDGAARAAQALGRGDVLEKLEAAWRGAPSLARLLRWLSAGAPAAATIRARAAAALSSELAPSARGLLALLSGDVAGAAALLKDAPGLGWSTAPGHPGGVLFPALVWLLDGEAAGRACRTAVQELRVAFQDGGGAAAGESGPRLATPDPMNLLARAEIDVAEGAERGGALEALEAAAERRVEGVLAHTRRGHYDHAAGLVACCVELRRAAGEPPSAWLRAIRDRGASFPAFRRALEAALAA